MGAKRKQRAGAKIIHDTRSVEMQSVSCDKAVGLYSLLFRRHMAPPHPTPFCADLERQPPTETTCSDGTAFIYLGSGTCYVPNSIILSLAA